MIEQSELQTVMVIERKSFLTGATIIFAVVNLLPAQKKAVLCGGLVLTSRER